MKMHDDAIIHHHEKLTKLVQVADDDILILNKGLAQAIDAAVRL